MMTGFKYVAEAIKAQGITHLFFVPKAFSCGGPAVIDVVSDYRVLHPRAWSE